MYLGLTFGFESTLFIKDVEPPSSNMGSLVFVLKWLDEACC